MHFLFQEIYIAISISDPVTPYVCENIMQEEVVDTTNKPHSQKVNGKEVVRIAADSYVEKVRFEGGNDTTPVGVLRPKDKHVSKLEKLLMKMLMVYFLL